MAIKASVAFFLSQTGDLIHVPHNHISTVIADPERFGLTEEEIQFVYDKYEEPLGLEGQARREILLQIIADGWIRIRRYPNRHWSVTASSVSPTVQELLQGWAARTLEGYGRLQGTGSLHAGESFHRRGRDRVCHQRPRQRLLSPVGRTSHHFPLDKTSCEPFFVALT